MAINPNITVSNDKSAKLPISLREAVISRFKDRVNFIGEDGGGCATVLFAQTRVAKIGLAIKFPASEDPSYVDQIRVEGRILKSLRHPNIVKIFEYNDEPAPHLVLELLSGSPLNPFVFSIREFLLIASQISAALEATAAEGIVHADLKPENLLVMQYPTTLPNGSIGSRLNAKLLDFGLARPTGRYDSGGLCRGTSEYMAPEHAQDPDLIDPSMDLYSLAFMLYERLHGDYVFRIGSDQNRDDYDREVMIKHIRGEVPALNSVNSFGEVIPPKLIKLAQEGTVPNPSLRISTIREFRERLIECMDLVA
jgi:serine/threonine protein kinase